MNLKTKFILFMTLIISLPVAAETLRDKNGEVMRGTPMVLGKPYANTSAKRALDIAKWKEVKDLGFNTVRVAWVDPFVQWDPNWGPKPGANWTVDEVLPKLDAAVYNATQSGMNIIINYHHVAEYQRTRGFGMMAEFWQKVAVRYKDNDRVFYELNNEQAWNATDYKSDAFKNGMRSTYDQVRRDAPNRHIILFSFHSMDLDMKGIADNYNWVDWSKTSVGYHFYGTGDMNQAIKNFEALVNSAYTTICTEWDYGNQNLGYVKNYYGYAVNAQALERFKQSSIDWRSWDKSDLGNTRDLWIPDAKAKGYFWDGAATNPSVQSAFVGHKIPGKIEAEDYDLGGSGVAFQDSTPGNTGNKYRFDDVDMESSSDNTGGTNVGWVAANEWLEYTIDNITPGTYDLDFRVASADTTNKTISFTLDRANMSSSTFSGTGGWQTWKTVTKKNIVINSSGKKVLRIVFNDSNINLNWVEFKSTGSPPPTTGNNAIIVRARGTTGG
jgi:hypothetical protein